MARRIRGSKGTVGVIVVAAIVVTGAVYAGKFIQEYFMDEINLAIGLRQTNKNPLPPNPATKPPQM